MKMQKYLYVRVLRETLINDLNYSKRWQACFNNSTYKFEELKKAINLYS